MRSGQGSVSGYTYVYCLVQRCSSPSSMCSMQINCCGGVLNRPAFSSCRFGTVGKSMEEAEISSPHQSYKHSIMCDSKLIFGLYCHKNQWEKKSFSLL